jgi:hypothetical protein
MAGEEEPAGASSTGCKVLYFGTTKGLGFETDLSLTQVTSIFVFFTKDD